MKKKFTIIVISILYAISLFSQTIAFQENFEGTTIKLTSSSTTTNSWSVNSTLAHQGQKSYKATVSNVDTTFLTSNSFSCASNAFVQLSFSQIAKIEYYDAAYIEVSANNGVSWTRLTSSSYLGSGYMVGNNKFCSISYTDWIPTNASAVPTNSWWKHESFNISSIAANTSQVKIRFVLIDGNINGAMGNYGWLLDSIVVIKSPSEIIPPTIIQIQPIPNDTVFSSSPIDITAKITDDTGIDTALLIYTVSSGVPDTIGMSIISPDTFRAAIPFYGYGHTISYYIKAIDSSPAHNSDSSATKSYYCKHLPLNILEIGSGTTSNGSNDYPSPFAASYMGNKVQYLILASEMTNAVSGRISSIGFNVANVNSCPALNDFEIKLGSTNMTSLATFNPNTNMTLVYSQPTGYQPTNGWNDFSLTNNFIWDGVSNIVIELCSKNGTWKNNGNASVYYSTTSFVATRYYRDDAIVCNTTNTGTGLSQRANIKLSVAGASHLNHDIGISSITNPTSGVNAGSAVIVKVDLKNYGADTISSATVKWKYDGALQNPAYSFTGSLFPDSVSSDIILDTINPIAGPHKLTIWSENPNGYSDADISNDSSIFDFFACTSALSGNYTIDPNGTAANNFTSFSDAALALRYCGISGSVVINVANGVYNEQISLPTINGSSATNTVIFQSASGDSSLVTLKYSPIKFAENYIIKLDGTSNIKFKGITIKSESNSLGRIFSFVNDVSKIAIENCVIINTNKASVKTDLMNLINGLSVGNDISIKNNVFSNGSSAIRLMASSTSQNWNITTNTIANNYANGIEIDGVTNLIIAQNKISQDTIAGLSNYMGIYIVNAAGNSSIKRNKIISKTSSIVTGIRIKNCLYSVSSRSSINNNFISINCNSQSTTQSAGIDIDNTPNVDIVYNSVSVLGAQAVSTALLMQNNLTDSIIIKNNIFANVSSGYAINTIGVFNQNFTTDYNDLFVDNAPTLVKIAGNNYTNISTYKAAISSAVHSICVNPYFISSTNLHSQNNLLNGAAVPLTNITNDIDGEVRNNTSPDIGADEFAPLTHDIAILKILSPVTGCGLSSSETIKIRIKNVGANNINGNLTASFIGAGSSTVVSQNITSVINAGATYDFTFTTTANLNVNSLAHDSLFDFKVWVNLQGDPVHHNDTIHTIINSKYTPPVPVAFTTSANYGTSATLTPTSNYSLLWWQYDTSTTILSNSSSFITPAIFDTTTYWVSAVNQSVSDTLSTTFQSSNQFAGNMFDITALNTITIDSFSVNCSISSTVEVWYRHGTYVGHTTSNVGWISLGSYNVSTMGTNIATSLPIGNLHIPAGQTYGIYITSTNGTLRCSVAPPANQIYQDANIKFKGGMTGNYFDVNFATYIWNGNIFYHRGGSGLACESTRIPDTVNVINTPVVDASVVSIINPVQSIAAGTQANIKAVIANYGTGTMTSATVNWKINNQIQTPITWTGNLASGQTDTVVLASNYTFIRGKYNFKVWTSMPNNTTDPYSQNDDYSAVVRACLHGTYTIGASGGSTSFDFPSFTSAIDALDSAGVCSDVVFNVNSGTYNEQIVIPEIFGSNSNATILFQSSTADSTDVILTHATTANNYSIKLDGCDYITFKQITIKATGSTKVSVIVICNESTHNSFINNIIQSELNSSISSMGFRSLMNSNDNYLLIENNHIIAGNTGISLEGKNSASKEKGTIIRNNLIEGFSSNGILVYYSDSVEISSNTIRNGSNSSNYVYGISMNYISNYSEINSNNIVLNCTKKNYGIRLSNNKGIVNKHTLLANNMIAINGGVSSNTGILCYTDIFTDIFNNTVNIIAGNTSSKAVSLDIANVNAAVNFANNNIINKKGYAIYIRNLAGIALMDNNNYYTDEANIAYLNGDISTLAVLQGLSNKDANSLNLSTKFENDTNLHLFTTCLSQKGMLLASVNTDIDGEVRNALPTIGADEIAILPKDIGVVKIININDTLNEAQTVAVKVIIKNFGTDTITACNIKYIVDGNTANYTYSNTLLPNSTDTVSLSSFVAPAGNKSICAYTSLSGDAHAFNDSTTFNFFGIPTKDAKLISVANITPYCGIQNDTIKVTIANIGLDTINASSQTTATTLSYKIDNGSIVSETFSQSIAPGDTVNYSFSNLAYLGTNNLVDSVHKIIAWINYLGDNNNINDTAKSSISVFHVPNAPTVVSPITISTGTKATLQASSTNPMLWYHRDTSTISLGSGSSFQTPFLYATDSFYVAALGGQAGGTVINGTGTAINNSIPMDMNNEHNYTQSIYTPNEFNNTYGNITKLYYYYNGNSITGPDPIKVYMGITNQSTFNNTYNWIPLSALTKVYDGTISTTNSAGWVEIILNTPFSYDGSGNLAIAFYKSSSNYYDVGDQFYCTNKASARSIYFYNSSVDPDPANPPVTALYGLGIKTYTPNIKVEIEPTGCPSQRVPIIVNVTSQLANDVGVLSINQPNSGYFLGQNDSVKVYVKNFGYQAQSNIPVKYSVNGGTIAIDTVKTTIAANDSVLFTFSQTTDLSSIGTSYHISAYTQYAGDVVANNDTIKKIVQNQLPTYCMSKANYNDHSEITDVSLGHYYSNSSVLSGALYTNFMQPTNAAIMHTGNGTPISISTTKYGTGSIVAGYIKVYIDYNRDGDFSDAGEEVFGAASQSTSTVTGSFTIPNTVAYGKTALRIVHQMFGSQTIVQPCGAYSYGETEDYLIDIMPSVAKDAGVVSIIKPNNMSFVNSAQVKVKIRNYGTDTIHSINIKYKLNGGSPVSNTFNSITIPPIGTAIYNLGNISLPQGSNSLCVYTNLTGDIINNVNDTLRKSIFREAVVNVPYSDNFETTDLWFADTLQNQWELGTPTMSNINTAHSPSKAWAIDLDSDYDNNSNDYLYSPHFVTSGADSILISFWQYYHTQTGFDGGQLQISVNNGYWLAVSYLGDPKATNWFTHNVGGTHLWSGNSNGWIKSTCRYDLTNADTIQFRYYFKSDGSTNNFDGWAIDDFEVSLINIANDVGFTQITAPATNVQIGTDVTVSGKIKNFGTATQNTFIVKYIVDNTTVIDTFNAAGSGLMPDSVANFTFTQPFHVGNNSTSIHLTTALTGDTYTFNDSAHKTLTVTPANIDAGIIAIDVTPHWNDTTKYSFNTAVKIKIVNYGSDTLYSIPLEYKSVSFNKTGTWTGTLLPTDTVTYTFVDTYKNPFGQYRICAKSMLTNDTYSNNDSICHTYFGINDDGVSNRNNIGFVLKQNRPNPANGKVMIDFIIPTDSKIVFELRNSIGQIIETRTKSYMAGNNTIIINTNTLSKGVYLYSVKYKKYHLIRKMMVN